MLMEVVLPGSTTFHCNPLRIFRTSLVIPSQTVGSTLGHTPYKIEDKQYTCYHNETVG